MDKIALPDTTSFFNLPVCFLFLLCVGCGEKKEANTAGEPANKTALSNVEKTLKKQKVIFDTDANNELDDQHALAYLLFNDAIFETVGVTVNATVNGGELKNHYKEAARILKLCNREDIPLLNGANEGFLAIEDAVDSIDYDGKDAVDFLLNQTKKDTVTVLAVGKLTNIALALKKDPTFAKRTKILWLGSNYPNPGEYNQENDTVAMNYVLNSSIPFELVPARYGESSGTDAVKVSVQEINERMPGKGPVAKTQVSGRHTGVFNNFGDYSVSLFKNIEAHDNKNYSRALFDMVVVAVLKNANWGKTRAIAAPILINGKWVERPNNPRKITLWEDFDKEGLITDFFETMDKATPTLK